MLESNPFFMNGIVSMKEKKRKAEEQASLFSSFSTIDPRNNVHYDWSGHKK